MIYFFVGDNQFEIKQKLDKLTQEFIKKFGDLAIERIDAEESSTGTIIDSIHSLPFLSPAKLVIINSATDKELLEKLIQAETLKSVTVVVIIPKVDKRAGYYKKLSKLPNFKLFEKQATYNLPHWVVEYTKSQEANISLPNARYLVERVGDDQTLLSNELNKLVLFNSQITKETINELTEPLPQSTVFQLLESAFAGRLKDVEELYKEQRSQKVEPKMILGMIAWQLHALAVIKYAGDRSVDIIAAEAKMNPFVVRKTQNLARNITTEQIKKMVKDAHELDLSLKTQKIDADQAILLYLITI